MVYDVNFVLRIMTSNESKQNHTEEHKTCKYAGVTDFSITSDKISVAFSGGSEEYHLGLVNSSEYVTIDSIEILPSTLT